MSIQNEIDRLNNNVSGTYSALAEAGADMPSEQNADNLPETAASIKAVLYSKEQALTDEQKAQARANIDAGTSDFSGNYDDLEDKPTLFSGSYNDLTDKPTLFSGSYNDLTDKPSTFPPAAHNQSASTITAGTFAGQVVANSSGQAATNYVVRNSKLSSAEEAPTVNGQICWKLK